MGALRSVVNCTRATAALGVGAALLTASCAGSDPGGSGRTAPAALGTAAPTVPAAARAATPEGAAAFARYFFEVYDHAFRTSDTTALRSVCTPDCTFCRLVTTIVDSAREKGTHVEGGRTIVTAADARPGSTTGWTLLTVHYDTEASRTLTRSGAVETQAPANPGQRLNVAVSWTGDHWALATTGPAA